MNRNVILIGLAGLVLLAVVGAVVLFNLLLGPTAAPSGQLTAVPVGVTPRPAATQPAAEATEPADGPGTQPAEGSTAQPASPAPATEAPAGGGEAVIFTLVPAESQARFTLSEDLRGQPNTVVGTTSELAGELAVNPADLSQTQVGVIQVNARTLATDNDRRNSAIGRFILQTDTYELITFTPTEVRGLSGQGVTGQAYTFQVAGDLTIRDITQPVVFDVTVTAESEERLSGLASTTVRRGDFNLEIPSVPNVANVSEEVLIELEFVAVAR